MPPGLQLSEQCTVVFVAYGSRGDVQPLALLALHLSHTVPGIQITLVTHQVHKTWLQSKASPLASLHLITVPTLPARVWMAGDPAAAAIPSQSSTKPEEERFTLTHNAVLEALGIHNSTPANTQQHQQLQARRTLLVFNLFVLETFSIAEALGIRCAAAHPYLIPYSCPATFQRRFKHTFPAQYAQLTDPCNRDSGAVSWGEVQHWMWPLWTERWSAFREELGLSPSPLEHSTQGSLPKAPPLLYGFSPSFVPRPGFWPESVHVCGFWSVPRSCCYGDLPQAPLDEHLSAWLGRGSSEHAGTRHPCTVSQHHTSSSAPGRMTLVADFGSTGAMGLIPRPGFALLVMARAARLLMSHTGNTHASKVALSGHSSTYLTSETSVVGPRNNVQWLLLAGGWHGWTDAHQQLVIEGSTTAEEMSLVHVWQDAVDHHVLLPQCDVILHHGGSGTTAAALHAGIPQVVVPVHFDQHFHAERLAHLELSPPPLAAPLLLGQPQGGTGADGRAEAAQPSTVTTLPGRDIKSDNFLCHTSVADPAVSDDCSERAAKRQRAGGTPAADGGCPQTHGADEGDDADVVSAAHQLAAAVLDALRRRPACQAYAQELAQEDGLAAACGVLVRMLRHA